MKHGASAASALALLFLATAAAAGGPRVVVVDDGVRVRREGPDLDRAITRGHALGGADRPIELAALRGEVVAIQVFIEAGDTPLDAVTVELAPPRAPVRVDRFIESYVEITARSRNDRHAGESLGWTPSSRPPDEDVLGAVPDALVPVEHAPSWLPYPLRIQPRSRGAIWIDVEVPTSTPPGPYTTELVVTHAGGALSRLPVVLDVASAELPYRATSFLAYYEPRNLVQRIGALEPAEKQLFQLLHRHHVDALGSIRSEADLERLRPALTGALYTNEHGYTGPGEGIPKAAVTLGAYGTLGDPHPDKLRAIEALVPKIPDVIEDIFLYAIDEQCESPRGPTWRSLLARSLAQKRVRVAHSCAEDPRHQKVDLVLLPSQTFQQDAALGTRDQGRDVWVYNGKLPHSGPLMLDAPATSLLADAWIAATRPTGRWFLWETTFWNDSNRGGRGPIDPFIVAETFHNDDGDSALGDGVLVYPGKQMGRFAHHSAGFDGVFPSMRLKLLRRGIQDAGYLALARSAHPVEADAITTRLLPRALDEVDLDEATPFPTDAAAYTAAREALRALIPEDARLDRRQTAAVLDAGRAARQMTQKPLFRGKTRLVVAFATLAFVATALAGWLVRRTRRRAS
ncbi:DUF4091 domain-containing protein [Polyangium jinanense]|uniref:DUF4091 domain-containing protein n=1 Tax=Polyangium jinanense TaxID=2829994 RepID=A0A9X3X7V3_9BACT|nr:glycoside hydrolase domain-containing protein [Polyangium jinanense]MDC3985292.1 DUF4091 domain-containing protein [Polyangium jinanense]